MPDFNHNAEFHIVKRDEKNNTTNVSSKTIYLIPDRSIPYFGPKQPKSIPFVPDKSIPPDGGRTCVNLLYSST